MRLLSGTAMLLFALNGCGHESTALAPPSVVGGWQGQTVSGQVVDWALQQNGTQVTGTGTFGGPSATYTVRGRVSFDSLNVRLVGAPDDTDADSVYFNGIFNYELYAGLEVSGIVSGPGPLNGPLLLFLESTAMRRTPAPLTATRAR